MATLRGYSGSARRSSVHELVTSVFLESNGRSVVKELSLKAGVYILLKTWP